MSDSERETSEQAVPWECFAHLTADKAELYRAIIELFAVSKAEFILHLRPADLVGQLRQRGMPVELDEVDAALEQRGG